jgi:hypothetical protein
MGDELDYTTEYIAKVLFPNDTRGVAAIISRIKGTDFMGTQ